MEAAKGDEIDVLALNGLIMLDTTEENEESNNVSSDVELPTTCDLRLFSVRCGRTFVVVSVDTEANAYLSCREKPKKNPCEKQERQTTACFNEVGNHSHLARPAAL